MTTLTALYEIFKKHRAISTDSRQIAPNSIFFALKGANFNGNQFAADALAKGAAFAVIDQAEYARDERCLLVTNVLETLQALAHHHRSQFFIPFIAITGSNGKTTTKELINAVLTTRYKVSTTKGNLNNHIGVPLTLLSIPDDAQMAVVEMGANHQREIALLCEIAAPSHGLITNIGKAHLEGFGGIEGVRKGKGELYDYLAAHGGTVFINADAPVLVEMSKEHTFKKVVSYGSAVAVQYHCELLQEHPNIICRTADSETFDIQSPLFGDYNFQNIQTAVAVGRFFQVEMLAIQRAIAAYNPENNRSQTVERGGVSFLLDAYNANPTSMQYALRYFASIANAQRIVILGDMLELGSESDQEHRAIVRLLQTLSFEKVVLVGQQFEKTERPDNFLHFPNVAAAKIWFDSQQFTGVRVLLKGSRGIRLEKILG